MKEMEEGCKYLIKMFWTSLKSNMALAKDKVFLGVLRKLLVE